MPHNQITLISSILDSLIWFQLNTVLHVIVICKKYHTNSYYYIFRKDNIYRVFVRQRHNYRGK